MVEIQSPEVEVDSCVVLRAHNWLGSWRFAVVAPQTANSSPISLCCTGIVLLFRVADTAPH